MNLFHFLFHKKDSGLINLIYAKIKYQILLKSTVIILYNIKYKSKMP